MSTLSLSSCAQNWSAFKPSAAELEQLRADYPQDREQLRADTAARLEELRTTHRTQLKAITVVYRGEPDPVTSAKGLPARPPFVAAGAAAATNNHPIRPR